MAFEMKLQRAEVMLERACTISSHSQRKLLVIIVHYAKTSLTYHYLKSERKMFENDRMILEKLLEVQDTHTIERVQP